MERKFLTDILTCVTTLIWVLGVFGYLGVEDIILNVNTYGKMCCVFYLFLAIVISTGEVIHDTFETMFNHFDIGDPT